MSKPHLIEAVHHLRAGHVIAYPTEAVWGLGCDPNQREAVARILHIKQRCADKGLILVAADMAQLADLLQGLSRSQRQRLERSWPGPVTWLIPDPNNLIPRWIKGRHDQVAMRVSAHKTVLDLCRGFGGTIVSTSANRSGEPGIRSKAMLEERLGEEVDYIVPGELGGETRPSRIRDLRTGEIIR